MKFKVVIQPRAVADMRAAFEWVRERAPTRGETWFEEMVGAIQS